MRKKEQGQGLVEFALTLPIMLMVLLGIFEIGMLYSDLVQANASAHNAVHAAVVHIVDGSGKSCYDRAMEALGEPVFLMAEGSTFTIEPCSDDPYWVGPMGAQVVGTWVFTINPVDFVFHNNFGFPVTVNLPFFKGNFR
ncbi:MAG TPA: TadE family protein [Patescibacteria group bacterium]|nr:TadE family protein [Patescibacteria group bacterium]